MAVISISAVDFCSARLQYFYVPAHAAVLLANQASLRHILSRIWYADPTCPLLRNDYAAHNPELEVLHCPHHLAGVHGQCFHLSWR